MKKLDREALRITLPKEWAVFFVKLAVFFFLSFLVLRVGESLRERKQEAVAAAVGGEKISRRDLEARLKKHYCAQVLDQLIDEKVLDLEAARKNVIVTKEAVDEELVKIKKGYPTDQAFRSDLQRRNWSLADVRHWLRTQILLEKLIKGTLTDKELQDYYVSHKVQYDREAAAWTRMILVKTTEQLAQVERALQSSSFEEAAKKYSLHAESRNLGGLLGWVTPSNMEKPFVDLVFKIPLKKPSPPLKTPNGYHIFYVEKRRPPHSSTFKEARDKAAQDLVREKKVTWLQNLKKNYKIKKFLCAPPSNRRAKGVKR